MGSCVLFICSVSVMLNSAGSGVNSDVVVLPALSVSWFSWFIRVFVVNIVSLVAVLCVLFGVM